MKRIYPIDVLNAYRRLKLKPIIRNWTANKFGKVFGSCPLTVLAIDKAGFRALHKYEPWWIVEILELPIDYIIGFYRTFDFGVPVEMVVNAYGIDKSLVRQGAEEGLEVRELLESKGLLKRLEDEK